MLRYLQSDRLHDVSGFPGASAYVGVGEIHYADVEARTRSRQATGLQTVIHPDATEFFRREDSIYVGVEEVFLLKGRYAPVKLYVFVSRDGNMPKPAFLAEWEGMHSRLLAQASSAHLLRRLVCGRAIEGNDRADATAEFSFDSVTDAATFYPEWSERMRTDAQGVVRPGSMVIVPAFVSLFYDRRFYEDEVD